METSQREKDSLRAQQPRLSSSDAKNDHRSSTEAPRDVHISSSTNEKSGVFEQCSRIESQPANSDLHVKSSQESQVQGVAETEKPPVTEADYERLSQNIARVRASTWWFLGAVILAIPLIILVVAFPKTSIDGIKVLGLLVWLEIVWTAGWATYLCVWFFGKSWYRLCQFELDEWEDFFLNTSTAQIAFVLSIVGWSSSSVMCRFTAHDTCDVHWLHILRKVLLATVPASAILLVKELVLEVMVTLQASRMVKGKQSVVFRQFAMFQLMFAPPGSEGSILQRIHEYIKKAADVLTAKGGGSIIFKAKPASATTIQALVMKYMGGEGREQDYDSDDLLFVDSIRQECRKNYTIMFTDEDGDLADVFDEENFQMLLDSTVTMQRKLSSILGDRPLTAREMVKMIDHDGSGEVTLEEFVEANVENIMAMRDISKSLNGMKRAAKAVNVVISCLLLCVVAIIYAAFFTKNLTTYLTPIWTTVTGLSFALGGTVTEFLSACQFVFSKQPYDVGDRVVIEDKELIVDEICLLYTIFHRSSDQAVEQIAHSKISDSWITNLTRSNGLWVKESAALPKGSCAISTAGLDKYRSELQAFIRTDPARKRYLDASNIRLSLQPGEDQHIVAEIKLNELIVRREDVLARARHEVRNRLDELVKAPITTTSE